MADGLVAALVRCQGKFPTILKGHTNPHYKSKYADLSDVLAAVRPVLSSEGIAVIQPIRTLPDGQVLLSTVLMGHGDELSSSIPLYLADMTPQQLGSTLTYYRRYMLASLLGVAADDDDDGNAAQTVRDKQISTVAATDSNRATGDPYTLAATNRPEKPLAAMTAGEMARYGESIGIRVSGNKSDILRQLEPYVKAAEGSEPFGLDGERTAPRDDPHDKLFEPVVASSIGDEPQ